MSEFEENMTEQELINYMLAPGKINKDYAAEMFLTQVGIFDGITSRYVKHSLTHLTKLKHLVRCGLATEDEYQEIYTDLRERFERVANPLFDPKP